MWTTNRRVSRSTTNTLIVLLVLAFCLCVFVASVDAYNKIKATKRFAKHLFRFVKREKKFFKKKGIEVAALAALGHVSKKKLFPLPIPLPIPIVHQPIIHEPMFFSGKLAAKGAALSGGLHGGGLGFGGGFGGFGGGLGGIGGFG